MERAREILKTGNIPISDVAMTVGYPNPLYFSRVFKRNSECHLAHIPLNKSVVFLLKTMDVSLIP
ncbi:AraC family transcriptional regulator [Bacillus sp. B6(2022)]|nr:AraC family transcriptional regulator [Bacillus sp. B6(2022)]